MVNPQRRARAMQGRWQTIPPIPFAVRGLRAAAAWTGDEVVVGGVVGDRVFAATFDPGTRTWRATKRSGMPWRDEFRAEFIAGRFVVWGGANEHGPAADGSLYDPKLNEWRSMASAPLAGRAHHVMVPTGSEVFVIGGVTDDGTFFRDGAAYDLRTNSWRDIAPVPGGGVAYATAEWTGDEIILWGGVSREGWSDGWRYDLATDSWKPTAPAPVLGRVGHATTWTGSEMVVWGGTQRNERGPHFADGAAYDPQANSWRGLPSSPISDRFDHTAVWTGSEFIVWGGTNEIRGDSMPPPLKDGAALAFADMSWRYLPPAPIGARYRHSSAWTGTQMLVWGGCCVSEESRAGYVDGAMYSPA